MMTAEQKRKKQMGKTARRKKRQEDELKRARQRAFLKAQVKFQKAIAQFQAMQGKKQKKGILQRIFS